MPRQPGGGRRSLLERAAASWAAKYLPDLELTAEELEMVGEFLRDYPYGSPYAFRNRRPAGCELSRETWLKLRDLVQRQADEPRRRVAGETARREGERRRVALAEHPDGEYLGGGLVRLRDGYVARSSASASNYELRCAIVGADGAAVKALVAQGRSLASLTSGDGLRDEFEADERRRENLDALAAMADELRREEGARMAAAGSGERSQGRPTSR